jgi:hypothetical protein
MKVYLLTEKDFERLTLEIDRDPEHGEKGGSSANVTPEERYDHQKAHRFFNYVIRRWIASVKEEG